MRRHWYKPAYWRWRWEESYWGRRWSLVPVESKVGILLFLACLGALGGYAAATFLPNGRGAVAEVLTTSQVTRVRVHLAGGALPNSGLASGRDVVTTTRTIGKVVYRAIAKRVETLPARTNYATVTQRSGVVTVAIRGKPVTTEITRTVTVNQRQLVTHLVTHQQTVTIQQTVTAGGRMVTNESTVTQPVTQVVLTSASTTTVPVTTTVSVTATLPASTVTRTVTVTTPGPTTTVLAFPTMTVTFPLGG